MGLNCIGVAYYLGLWFPGEAWHSAYHILQATRLMILWNIMHELGHTSSGENQNNIGGNTTHRGRSTHRGR